MTDIAPRQQPVSEQVLAQAELNQHITNQAQAVAPEIATVEIHSHHFEMYAGNQLIAYITYDNAEFITQRWVVMVRGIEQFRHNTIARCLRYVEWHHKDGSLPTPLPAPIEYPEVPRVAEISFHDQELIVDGELIASIEYDHDNYQDLYWRVLVNNVEIYRNTTPARCHSYVKQAYQQGMLPVQEPFEEEEFSLLHPAPSSENRIMVHIFNECQKYGLDILDDGIYHNDLKVGQVGCTNGNWWVILGCSGKAQYSNSVFDAVRALVPVSESGDAELDDCEHLLDLPFEMLTAQDWQRLLEYEPVPELIAA
ncbi:hypothetical protein [Anabaena azotica]|uniref:Uncharacterized protein n=1 Tax=Anabaena azotica FACHB-119 TaxID=947527 RepID=A0ABR8DFC8_9NOST|nr:hypothetical protein [Anabaena azotica]MBD2505681.1 hypothetical protein [Anabaena azotica FACHB-119]